MTSGLYVLELFVLVLVIVVARVVAEPWIQLANISFYTISGYTPGSIAPALLFALSVTVIAFGIFFLMEHLGLYFYDKNDKFFAMIGAAYT
ncbi:Transmembrane domain-containing protein [Brazilian cedratvirus IHUMI]|uniref:Transmembrane domain-containing protein n=1 Tax=Brazilian cedratvirus IHUMI TaxID=2126980 RepID=A0A2R8FDU6_9VIRU|nr:Transmembrane domain-containing protein [Brazilian cedratvirus IHUMI]